MKTLEEFLKDLKFTGIFEMHMDGKILYADYENGEITLESSQGFNESVVVKDYTISGNDLTVWVV